MPEPAAVADLDRIRHGGKRAVAATLAAIELRPRSADVLTILDAAYGAPVAHVIGITGPPGVGKSTLTSALVSAWRKEGLTAGVLAVDPSSRMTGGALLGDRTRFAAEPGDQGVYFRSLAARGRLGGLSDLVYPYMVLFRALFDRVIVESVGVGQSEAAITSVADTVVLCVQPASGDSLQFMKAGIMEIPHVAVVTKADMGTAARRAEAELAGALMLAEGPGREPVTILSASATTGEGMDRLHEALEERWRHISDKGLLTPVRRAQAEDWLRETVRNEAGQRAEKALAARLQQAGDRSPFGFAGSLLETLSVSIRDG